MIMPDSVFTEFQMHIAKITIENFKCFEGRFSLGLNEGKNILVGNNEAGKSTILEAIHPRPLGRTKRQVSKK